MSNHGRVLIIDDCGVTTYFLRAHLERFGFDVRTVGTGEEGLAIAEQFIPDAVVLDRKLPGMFGEEVCRRLRAHSVLKHSAVVMLTSTSDDTVRREMLQLGADEFIVKPIQPDDIASRLERAISTRRALRARESEPASRRADSGTVEGQMSLRLHAHMSLQCKELAGHLEGIRESSTLTLKERKAVDATLDIARSLMLSLLCAELLPIDVYEPVEQ